MSTKLPSNTWLCRPISGAWNDGNDADGCIIVDCGVDDDADRAVNELLSPD